MKTNSKLKMLGFFVVVVAISGATNFALGLLSKSSNSSSFSQSGALPAAYANFSKVASALETDFTLAAELSVNAVVHVKTKTPVQQNPFGFQVDPFFEYFFGRPQQRQPQEAPMREGAGSGVIISSDGYIVTNNHVIDRSKEIEVTLNDKRTYQATVVGADPSTDIALIKIDAKDLPVIIFGNSDDLKVGEWVLAVGNPFNLTSTVTAGIVSAKARSINILSADMRIEAFIQTDAAVNPGNSGGALVNTKGELVGINTAIASQTGSFAGYSFAVPTTIVQKVVSDIRQFGVVQRAVMGVHINDITDKLAREKNLKTLEGVYVEKVLENGAAIKAGVKDGDVIQSINGTVVKTTAQLQEQIGRYRPGDKVVVELLRNNKKERVTVELKNLQGNTGVVSANVGPDILGATFKDVDEKLKSQLGINYGIQVDKLQKGKLQEQGVRSGYIVLKVNNQIIRTEEDLKLAFNAALNAENEDKVLFLAGIYPNGKVTYYAVNLAD